MKVHMKLLLIYTVIIAAIGGVIGYAEFIDWLIPKPGWTKLFVAIAPLLLVMHFLIADDMKEGESHAPKKLSRKKKSKTYQGVK